VTLATLASFLLPLVTGCLLIQAFWPARFSQGRGLVLRISLGLGYGLGTISSLFFLWLATLGPRTRGLTALEVIICLALTLLCVTRRRLQKAEQPVPVVPSGFNTNLHSSVYLRCRCVALLDVLLVRPGNRLRVGLLAAASVSNLNANWYKVTTALRICFWALFISALVSFVILSLDNPHGLVDAWGQWNLRARFIFRAGGEYWARACDAHIANPDYPLLLPAMIAHCWKFIGQDILAVQILVAMLFMVGTVGLLSSSVSVLRGSAQGYLSGIVLLGTPFFIKHVANQYADVPIGFYYLAAIVFFCLHDSMSSPAKSMLVLAGTAAGFASWTKNEGLLFIAAILIARFIAVVPSNGVKVYLRQAMLFAAGLLPLLLLNVYFRATLAGSNQVFASQSVSVLIEKLFDAKRYVFILKSAAGAFYAHFALPVCALAVYAWLFRAKGIQRVKLATITSMTTICIMLLGYFFIYLITPLDLGLHVGTSLHRLLLQLWPSFLFGYFLTVRSPEEVLKQ
jgi:hypothetical protein